MRIEYQLKLFSGEGFIDVPNMQKVFLDEQSAKKSLKFAKLLLKKYGVTHYEIVKHNESFDSKGKFSID